MRPGCSYGTLTVARPRPERAPDAPSVGEVPPSPWTAPRRGMAAAVVLVTLAAAVPPATGWAVHATAHSPGTVAPLHATWRPMAGIGTPLALLVAVLGIRYADRLATTLRWPRLLVVTYAGSLAWGVSLALVYGVSGLSRDLTSPAEPLITARGVHDVPALLHGFIARIPLDSVGNWPTHVAGHPPGLLLAYVALVRLGLGSALAAGLVITVIGCSTPVAVLVTLGRLGAEDAARRAAPFLVLGPAALWVVISSDGVFGAVAAWGLAALAAACTARGRVAVPALAIVAGLLLGSLLVLSYGLELVGLLALAVVTLAGGRRVVPVVAVAAVAAVVPTLVLAHYGFDLWAAFPVLRRRYWDGLAHSRPNAYWVFGDLAALLIAGGPVLGEGLGQLVVSRDRADRVVRRLAGAAVACIGLADLSLMSKGEVERIWLPFVPWLLISTALLPRRWRAAGLVLQVVVALLVEHLLDTGW